MSIYSQDFNYKILRVCVLLVNKMIDFIGKCIHTFDENISHFVKHRRVHLFHLHFYKPLTIKHDEIILRMNITSIF